MRKMTVAVILIIAIVFLLCSCTATSGENIVFSTFYRVELKGANCYKKIKSIDNLFEEIENQVSTSLVTSDVYKINNAEVGIPIPIGKHTKVLFSISKQMYDKTDGAFNATIFPLVELWNFSPEKFKYSIDTLPSASEINALLPYCSFECFEFDETNQTITRLHKNAKLDFGGIAKGYAVDCARDISGSCKDALINVGGNITTFGRVKKIGLEHPRESNSLFGVLDLTDLAIATSGDYERFYVIDNVRYSHIIKQDGWAMSSKDTNNIISVSVIGESALMCDVYSTAVMILGSKWAKDLPKANYSCIIISDNDYKIIGDINFESRQSTHQKV